MGVLWYLCGICFARYRYLDWRLFHLRTGAGVEIDHLIERPGLPTVLIEIKSAERVNKRDTRVLEGYTGDFDQPLALCVSRDVARMQVGGVLCLHWWNALGELGFGDCHSSVAG